MRAYVRLMECARIGLKSGGVRQGRVMPGPVRDWCSHWLSEFQRLYLGYANDVTVLHRRRFFPNMVASHLPHLVLTPFPQLGLSHLP